MFQKGVTTYFVLETKLSFNPFALRKAKIEYNFGFLSAIGLTPALFILQNFLLFLILSLFIQYLFVGIYDVNSLQLLLNMQHINIYNVQTFRGSHT